MTGAMDSSIKMTAPPSGGRERGGRDPRKIRVTTIAVLIVLSAVLHLYALRGAHGIPSDTNSFLSVVALFQGGETMTEQAPMRVSNPLYPSMIYLANLMVPDWVAAARITALIPAVLTGAVLCLVGWSLTGSYLPGLFSGLFGVASPWLLDLGISPLSDSTFVFFSALFFLSALHLLEKPGPVRGGLSGLLAGLAYATRGPGLFYPSVVVVPLLLTAVVKRRRDGNGPATTGTGRKTAVVLLVFLAAFVLFGKGPAVLAGHLAGDMEPPHPYLKLVFIDGGFYAKGGAARDRFMYSLGAGQKDFLIAEEVRLPWSQIFDRYGEQQLRGAIRNLRTNFSFYLRNVSGPVLVSAPLLILGLIRLVRTRAYLKLMAGGLLLFPFLFVIPFIQLHQRYVVPVVVVLFPFMATGLADLVSRPPGEKNGSRAVTWAVPGLIFLLLFTIQLKFVIRQSRQPDWDRNYRAASAWINRNSGSPGDFAVMSRYHGVYAYLKRRKTSLPVNSLNQVARYCLNTNTRFIIVGRTELGHNLELRRVLREGTVTLLDGQASMHLLGSFGRSGDRVYLVEVRKS